VFAEELKMDLTQLDDVRGTTLLESAVFFTELLSGAKSIAEIARQMEHAAKRSHIEPDVLKMALTALAKPNRGAEQSARFLLAAGITVGLDKEVNTALEGAGKKQGFLEIGLIATAIIAGLVQLRKRLNTSKMVIEIDRNTGLVRIEIIGTPAHSYTLPPEILSFVQQLLRPTDQLGTDSEPNETKTVATMLERLERLVLPECVVVGKYFRYDHAIRNTLKDWVRRIQGPLLSKTSARENYLIWAAPGSGKTYLIQQAADDLRKKLGGQLNYIECNLAKDERDQFVKKVDSLESQTRPTLCLLDEIDARASEDWPYETCFPKLDLNLKHDKQLVIVLIGSTPSSMHAMVESIRGRKKGQDLVDRILRDEKCFEIPATTMEDGAAMVVGQVVELLGTKVHAVEKLALFYILCNESLKGSPRQLSEFIKAAASRFGENDERLRFHHLFRPEDDDKRFAFRKANEELVDGLSNVDVLISP
jgi:hypothetical protein